jgi:MFS family permease
MWAVSLYVPFMDGANRLYQVRFCFSQVTSGKAIVITYLVAAAGSAPLGLLIDKVGHKRYFMVACFCIFTIAQSFILFFPQCSESEENGSIVGLALIGLGYCFYGNCIIASIPLVAKKKVLGTAFGLQQMIENFGLAFFPLITGSLVDHAPSL